MKARRYSRAGIALGCVVALIAGLRVYYAMATSAPVVGVALAMVAGLVVAAAVVFAATWVMRNARFEVASWGIAFGLVAFFFATVAQSETLPVDKWLVAMRAFPVAVVVAVVVMAGVGLVLSHDRFRSAMRYVGALLLWLALIGWFALLFCGC
jgi:hypothetical protein